MRMMTGRPPMEKDGFQFNLDDARPMGPQHIIRAARDPIARVPTDDKITALLQRTLCRAKLSEDNTQWEISGMVGEPYVLTLGATYELWEIACEGLLKQALENPE